jgi:uncharacterized cupredoxin-like copper-binding protein
MTSAAGRASLNRRGLSIAIASVLLLAIGSTVAVAAGLGGFGSTARDSDIGVAGCTSPVLPGTTVAVRLMESRPMTVRGAMMGSPRGMMDPDDRGPLHHQMMRILAAPTSVPAGTVSLAVTNTGRLGHELVVLPLPDGQQPGSRSVGHDGRIDESSSLGEASAACAAGAGDGIVAGSRGWVSLRLPPGRYELACNLPGHYAAGMFAELDLT